MRGCISWGHSEGFLRIPFRDEGLVKTIEGPGRRTLSQSPPSWAFGFFKRKDFPPQNGSRSMSICYSPILPPTPKEEPKSEEYSQGREEALSQVSKWLRGRRADLVSAHAASVKPSPKAEMLASRIYEIDFLIDGFNNGAYVPEEPTP